MKPTKLFLTVLTTFGLTAGTASADLTGGSVSGPGGTGNLPINSGTLTEPNLFFSSIDYIDVTLTVDSAGTYNFNQAPSFGNTFNNTGVTWTGFDLILLGGGVGTFINNPPAVSSWQDYPGGALASFSSNHIVFSGENIPTSSSFAFTGYLTTSGPGSLTVRETPIAAPEPSSLLLTGLGTLGAGFVRRRK